RTMPKDVRKRGHSSFSPFSSLNIESSTRRAKKMNVPFFAPYGAAFMNSPFEGQRGVGRPVKRRTRTFRPNYLSFAGTYQCNLTCPHCCVPIEWTDRLDVAAAVRFLEDAWDYGVRTLGLTGGEPFLFPEFVHTVCRRAAEL